MWVLSPRTSCRNMGQTWGFRVLFLSSLNCCLGFSQCHSSRKILLGSPCGISFTAPAFIKSTHNLVFEASTGSFKPLLSVTDHISLCALTISAIPRYAAVGYHLRVFLCGGARIVPREPKKDRGAYGTVCIIQREWGSPSGRLPAHLPLTGSAKDKFIFPFCL